MNLGLFWSSRSYATFLLWSFVKTVIHQRIPSVKKQSQLDSYVIAYSTTFYVYSQNQGGFHQLVQTVNRFPSLMTIIWQLIGQMEGREMEKRISFGSPSNEQLYFHFNDLYAILNLRQFIRVTYFKKNANMPESK